LEKVIDRPLEFTLWKSGERHLFSVFVEDGVIGGELTLLLEPGEAAALLANMRHLELKAVAVRNNPGLFADEAVDLSSFD
jgi:hypothetical protein